MPSSLQQDDICVIVGLCSETGRPHNFKSTRVVDIPDVVQGSADRIGTACLHSSHKLSIKRQNLLKMADLEDRRRLLVRVVWEKQQGLRVARAHLLDKLSGEEGLCLHIASFFPPRTTMALTTGFACGKMVKDWTVARLRGGQLSWQPIHTEGDDADRAAEVYGASSVPDGIVRIDCAVVDIGCGRFMVAGGCNNHPRVAEKFNDSAFIYDSITHAVTPLPSMPVPRHGCGGALIDDKVYIVGGEYVAPSGDHKRLISVYDLKEGTWSSQGPGEDENLHVAFAAVGSISGRLVVVVEGCLLVYNPIKPTAGLKLSPQKAPVWLGRNAQACTSWGDYLVVSSGRSGCAQCWCAYFYLALLELFSVIGVAGWQDFGSRIHGSPRLGSMEDGWEWVKPPPQVSICD